MVLSVIIKGKYRKYLHYRDLRRNNKINSFEKLVFTINETSCIVLVKHLERRHL